MASIADYLGSGILTGSLAAILIAGASQKVIIKAITIVNDTAGALDLRIEAKPTGAGTLRPLIADRSLASKGTELCPEVVNHILQATGELHASGAGLEYYITGIRLPQNP